VLQGEKSCDRGGGWMKEFSKYSISLPLAQNGMLSTSQFFFFFEENKPVWDLKKSAECVQASLVAQ